jgi:hypothetical protein
VQCSRRQQMPEYGQIHAAGSLIRTIMTPFYNHFNLKVKQS